MALHIKYRPKSLNDVIGNDAAKESLGSLLRREKEDIPHSFLFTGPSGCGKTTLGRILAQALGCNGMDLTEIDMADLRGIDNIREITNQMRLRPMDSDCRVWILDECHRITGDGQSALLKALEDTPKHVYFILCTTDPGKLLETIRNRCLNYQVNSLDKKEIRLLLKNVSRRERKEIPGEIIDSIAENALGSARQALVMLDKVMDCDEEQMQEAIKGFQSSEHQVVELCRLLASPKGNETTRWKQALDILNGLKGENPETIRFQIMKYLNKVLISRPTDPNHQAGWAMGVFYDHATFNLGLSAIYLATYRSIFIDR